MKPFLRRTKIMPDEFLLSYLLRTAAENHYDSVRTFRSVIHEYSMVFGVKDKLYSPVRAETYSVLSKLCGVPDTELFQHTIHRFANILFSPSEKPTIITLSDGVSYLLADHESHRRNCRPESNAVFCPDCLKESAYYRINWHILASTSCLKHNLLLVDSCQRCGANLSIQDIIKCRCPKCQFDLRATQSISIADDKMSYVAQEILDGWTGNGEEIEIIPGVSTPTLYRIYMGLRYCIQAKSDWGYLHPFPDYFATPQSKRGLSKWVAPIKYLHRLNVTAIKAFSNFPNGIFEFFDAYRGTKGAGSITQGLGYLYWGWIDKRWLFPEYEFLQNAYNEYLATRENILTPSIAKAQRILQKPDLKKNFQYITASTAAEELNTDLTNIDRFVKAGIIGGKYLKQNRCGLVVLQSDVQAFKPKLENSVDLVTASKLLETTRLIILPLVRAGVLEAIRGRTADGSANWSITSESIVEFQRKISDIALPLKNMGQADVKKFPQVLQQMASWRIGAVELLNRILDGKTRVYLETGKEVTINSIYLAADTSENIKEEIKKQNNWISHMEFAKMAGVKRIVVSRWVNDGLIKPATKFGKSLYFDKDSVDDFLNNFLTTREVARLLEISVLTAQIWARAGRLKAVCGRGINGGHEYRFRRDEVEVYKKENRLTAPQMAKHLGISKWQMRDMINKGKIIPISGPGIDGAKQRLFSSTQM